MMISRYIPVLSGIVLCTWLMALAVPTAAFAAAGGVEIECAMSCSQDCGTDKVTGVKFKDVGACCKKYGCCPVKPQKPFATQCASLVSGQYFDEKTLFGHSGKEKVPHHCKNCTGENVKGGVKNAMWNPSMHQECDHTCNSLWQAEDKAECEGESVAGERKTCLKKVLDKGVGDAKDPCKWRDENIMYANGTAIACSSNPDTPGFTKLPFGAPELLCVQYSAPVPAPNDNAYKATLPGAPRGRGTASPSIDARAPSMMGTASLAGAALADANLSAASLGGAGGSKPCLGFDEAGKILAGVALSVMPSNQMMYDENALSGKEACPDPAGEKDECVQGYLGNPGCQKTDRYATDPKGRDVKFNYAAAHGERGSGYVYDDGSGDAATIAKNNWDERKEPFKGFAQAYLNTPAYAVYNPNDYAPGQEMAMVRKLQGKSVEEVLAAKEFGDLVVSESLAAAPSGGTNLQGLVERLWPDVAKFVTNSTRQNPFTGQSFSQASYGHNLTSFFGAGANGLLPFLSGGGGGGMMGLLQQILQGGGGGNQPPPSCTPQQFGNIDQCAASLSAAPEDVDLSAFSFPGCPRPVLDCMDRNTLAELSRCYSALAEEKCDDSAAGGGGGGGGGGMPSILSQLKNMFGNMGGFKDMKDLMKNTQKPKQLSDLYKTPFLKIFDPTHPFSPRDKLSMGTTDRYRSRMAALPASRMTEHKSPYSMWTNYCPPNMSQDAARCAGTRERLIMVDEIAPRTDKFNSHMMQRMHYNRWCKADPGGCCVKCSCPPKPCPPWIPCWSNDCWAKKWCDKGPRCKRAGISCDKPPAGDDWDDANDLAGYNHMIQCCPLGTTGCCTKAYPCRGGFCGETWGYHPDVKSQLAGWAQSTKADLMLNAKEEFINDVCHDLAAPLPGLSPALYVPAKKYDNGGGGLEVNLKGGAIAAGGGGGSRAMEGMGFTPYFGCSRPYMADPTNKWREVGQTGQKPDLNSCDGGAIVANYDGNIPSDTAPGATAAMDMMPKVLDMGFYDGGLGAAKQVLAQATGGNQGSKGPCYGGAGGACSENGTDPNTGFGEMKISQMQNKRKYGLCCMMGYERSAAMDMAEGYFSRALGSTHNWILEDKIGEGTDGDGGSGPRALLRSTNLTSACRGAPDHVDAAERFPKGGGVQPPEEKEGLQALFDQGSDAGGAVLLLPTGGALPGTKPDLPTIAMVKHAVEIGGGPGGTAMLGAAAAGGGSGTKCLLISLINCGPNRDHMGRSGDEAGKIVHRYACEDIPEMAKAGIKEMAPHRTDCVCSDGPQFCKIDWKGTKWVHYGETNNKSIK